MLLCYYKEIGINPNYKYRTLQNFEALQPSPSEGPNSFLINCFVLLPPILYKYLSLPTFKKDLEINELDRNMLYDRAL